MTRPFLPDAGRREPWIEIQHGWGWDFQHGWGIHVRLFPARDLMTSREEGQVVLCALYVSLMILRPRHCEARRPFRWRVTHHSHFEEITRRRAGDFSGGRLIEPSQ